MKNITAVCGSFLVILASGYTANAQDIGNPDAGVGNGSFTEMKDQLRGMTYTTRLRNSEFDQWKYLTDLREAFEGEISTMKSYQAPVQQVKNYCANDTDAYTCKREDLVISVDSRMSAAIMDWQNAILVIDEIEKTRGADVPESSRSKELSKINAQMNDIDRLNERAKKEFNLASAEMVEFQEQNPRLFTNGSN